MAFFQWFVEQSDSPLGHKYHVTILTVMRSASILSTLLIGLGCADAFVSPSSLSACIIGNDKNIRAVPTSSSLSELCSKNNLARWRPLHAIELQYIRASSV
jgi:hypothetical protein